MDINALDWDRLDPSQIPDKFILNHPLVSELAESASLDKFQYPLIIKDKILMDEGNWNKRYYSADSIQRAFDNTDWANREKSDLYLDHEDQKASEWAGTVENKRIEGKRLVGDLIIHDWPLALKMASGKPKFGISPKVSGKTNTKTQEMVDFVFDNFSIVINPAVKTAYINNMDESVSEIQKMEVSDKMAEVNVAPIAEVKVETAAVVPTEVKVAEVSAAVVAEVAVEEKATEVPAGEDLSEKAKQNDAMISGLEALLSELRAKQESYKPAESKLQEDIKEMASSIQKLQIAMSKIGSVPDRRSVKVESNDSTDLTIKLKEIQKDPDEAMRKWMQTTSGGRY